MSVHQPGMMEPMIMMGMMDNAPEAGNGVGINYSANRPTFPPPQAHTAVPNTVPSNQPQQVQALQNHTNTAIVAQLLQTPLQRSVQQVPQPPAPIHSTTLPNTLADNVDASKPKKARKKKPEDVPGQQKPDVRDAKLKKKKTPKKKKTKQKKSDGTVSLLGKKGKTLDAQAREIALNVAEYFKREAELGRTLMPLHSYQKRAAAATGISTATLRKLEGARREFVSERVVAEAMVEDPFPDLEISDTSVLDNTDARHKCRKCCKSRKFFCYNCCTANPQLQDKVPRVKLPVKIDIIKHQNDIDGKSTCPHAVVIAPDDVTVYTFPYIPEYDKEKVVVVYPCKEASTLKELLQASNKPTPMMVSNSSTTVADPISTMMPITTTTDSGLHTPRPEQVSSVSGFADIPTSSTYADLQTIWTNAYIPQPGPSASMQSSGGYTYLQPLQLFQAQDFNTQSGNGMSDTQDSEQEQKPSLVVNPPFERAVFIDCPWNQTKAVIEDNRLKDLRRVEIKDHETHFWCFQEGQPTTHLSTIEAIYYLVREFHEDVLCCSYLNEYDNLLWFFLYFYHKIRLKYQGSKEVKTAQS